MISPEISIPNNFLVKMIIVQAAEKRVHAQNVASVSAALAGLVGYTNDECHRVYLGAFLHDIGKQFVPDSILEKPNALTRVEFENVQSHPLAGYIYLRRYISDRIILNSVLYHHERLNGTGYPCGLKHDKIPLEARICTIADVWDALFSNRCYHSAWDMSRALEFILDGAGSHFDPKLVLLFLRLIEEDHIMNIPKVDGHVPDTIGRYLNLEFSSML